VERYASASADSDDDIEIGYIGNKGSHIFAGNGPAYNANEAAIAPELTLISARQSPADSIVRQVFAPSIPQANRRRFNLNGVPAFNLPQFPVIDPVTGLPKLDASGNPIPLTCCSSDIGNYFGNDASSHYSALQVKSKSVSPLACSSSDTIPFHTLTTTTAHTILLIPASPTVRMISAATTYS